jgi:hypothetical protein
VSDLTAAQWREVEAASIVPNGMKSRFIGLETLRTIIRRSRRTNEQNALLWSLYGDIIALGGEAMRGWDSGDLHDFFLVDYFGAETVEMFGRKKLKPLRRSSRLTKAEFADYVEHIVRFMAERGVCLTLPGDLGAA